MCRSVRESGVNGVTDEEVAQHLGGSGNTPGTAALGAAPALLGVMQNCGLICRVSGYASWAYVAAEHSGRFLAGSRTVLATSLQAVHSTRSHRFLIQSLAMGGCRCEVDR